MFKELKERPPGSHKTGELTGLTVDGIESILGFAGNCADDPDKVENSWCVEYKGHLLSIWDYKGSQNWMQFSTHGNPELFREVFGRAYSER
jgi:hypothetical protein